MVGRLVVQKQRAASVEHASRRIRRHRAMTVDGRHAAAKPAPSQRAVHPWSYAASCRLARLGAAPGDPGAKLFDQGRAVAEPALEALLEALAEAVGLGVDVADLCAELEPFVGAHAAVANGFA